MYRSIRGSIYYPSALSVSLATPQPEKWYTRWIRKMKLFFWNPDNRTCMNKTLFEWLLFSLYYAVYFVIIIGIFTATLIGGMKLLVHYRGSMYPVVGLNKKN